MKKNKFLFINTFVAILTMLFLIGCGKSDKNVTTTGKKTEKKETFDTSKFYSTSDFKYWQNYPGKTPSGEADMVEVKAPAQIDKIKVAIMGHGSEDVYT